MNKQMTKKMTMAVEKISKDIEDYSVGEIIRYSGKHKLKEESVAEHSFMTAVNVIRFCELAELPNEVKYKATTLAVLHDIDEAKMGDVPFDAKKDSTTKKAFEEFERTFTISNEGYYSKRYGEDSKEILQDEDTLETRIVKLCDALSVMQYANREAMMGNLSDDMLVILDKTPKRFTHDLAYIYNEYTERFGE